MREIKIKTFGQPREYIGEIVSEMRRNSWRLNFSRKWNDRMKSGRISALTDSFGYTGSNFAFFDSRDCERFLNTEPERSCFTCFAEKVKSKLWNRNPRYTGMKTRPCGISEGVRIHTLFTDNKKDGGKLAEKN